MGTTYHKYENEIGVAVRIKDINARRMELFHICARICLDPGLIINEAVYFVKLIEKNL